MLTDEHAVEITVSVGGADVALSLHYRAGQVRGVFAAGAPSDIAASIDCLNRMISAHVRWTDIRTLAQDSPRVGPLVEAIEAALSSHVPGGQ